MKLRERLELVGLSEVEARKAVSVTMAWLAELASTANRSRVPGAEQWVQRLREEETPVSPPAGETMTYDGLTEHLKLQETARANAGPPAKRTELVLP